MPTRPGFNPTFDMALFTVREQRIIRRLARHFYLTRAADITQVGNSNYRSLLMRPAEDVSVALNVEREVAVLFADYETFEARTLRAFDLTYDQFDDVRVDRSLRFLVSGDPDIESSIRHYLLQNPEYPIVVPFRYDDFLDTSNGFFFDAIRKNYLIRDLFGYQSPLKHEYFFWPIEVGRSGNRPAQIRPEQWAIWAAKERENFHDLCDTTPSEDRRMQNVGHRLPRRSRACQELLGTT